MKDEEFRHRLPFMQDHAFLNANLKFDIPNEKAIGYMRENNANFDKQWNQDVKQDR